MIKKIKNIKIRKKKLFSVSVRPLALRDTNNKIILKC